jgi:putative NIF3 family GTP cyclohydrolase 1 type 2
MVADQRRLSGIIKALMASHPYEEPAYDIYPLLIEARLGLGIIGLLPRKITFQELGKLVAEKLEAKSIQVLGEPGSQVERLAICSGNGGSLIQKAANRGAEVFLTGEIDYHDFLWAKESGLGVIAAGHWTTEKGFISLLTRYLKEFFKDLPDFEVIPSNTINTEPYVSLM